MTNTDRTSRRRPLRRVAIAVAAATWLTACGGGGGGGAEAGGGASPAASVPDAGTFTLAQTKYTSGDAIALEPAGASITRVTFRFESSGRSVEVPVAAGQRFVLAPPLPASLRDQALTLIADTPAGAKRSTPITIGAYPTDGATPGFSAFLYLDAARDRIGRGISDFVNATGESASPDLDTLRSLEATISLLRQAVLDAMAGRPTLLARTTSGEDVYLGPAELDELDQVFLVLHAVATRSPDILYQGKAAASAAVQDSALIEKVLGCTTLDGPNRARCVNFSVSQANDYLLTGAQGVGIVAGVVGVAAVLLGAPVLGAGLGVAAAATTVYASIVGGALQVASASGTGTTQGLDTVPNVQALGQTALDAASGPVSRLLPAGNSRFVETLYSLLTQRTLDRVVQRIDQLRRVPRPAPPTGNAEGLWSATFSYGTQPPPTCLQFDWPARGTALPDVRVVRLSAEAIRVDRPGYPGTETTLTRLPSEPEGRFSYRVQQGTETLLFTLTFSADYRSAEAFFGVVGVCPYNNTEQLVRR
jgi:hypothetical protein